MLNLLPKKVFINNADMFIEYEDILTELKSLIDVISMKNLDAVIQKFNTQTVIKINEFLAKLNINDK